MNYFYRIDTSTELGKRVRSFLNECDKANWAADIYCQKVGAKTFYDNPDMMAGGVVCVGFGDKEVDNKLWRSVGKDADGYEMWEPNCQSRQDCIILPRRNFKPSDTATRVYQKRLSSWREVSMLHTQETWMQIAGMTPSDDKKNDWNLLCKKMEKELFIKYTELYINNEQRRELATNPHYRMPLWMKRAIHLELQRLRLPVVSIRSLYAILQTDLGNGSEGKKKIIQPVTPVIFKMYGYYYIGCEYPCTHQELESLTPEKFQMKKDAFANMINAN